ncbi:MAG: V-type ATP synthase subunit B, partial [Clostridiales bacterium]|nr:V-type ATP synthase subunit B [Clostridiales bacterium]
MSIKYIGLSEINGPLVVLDNVKNIGYDEIAKIKLTDGTTRLGRVVEVEGERAVLQIFEGTTGLSLTNTTTELLGKPLEIPLSTEMLGRIFNGAGSPIDSLGDIFPDKTM